MLFAAMGLGCQQLSRIDRGDTDILVDTWTDERVGIVRGTWIGIDDYGGTIFCENGNIKLDAFKRYDLLLDRIVSFYDTRELPFNPNETLEICAF